MLVTLIGISIIIFVLLRVVPGNIVDILFDAAGFVDPADKANLERELGLNQPIVVQYLQWIGGLLHGDLGYSYVSEKPALEEILPRIPITARLAGLALLFSASTSRSWCNICTGSAACCMATSAIPMCRKNRRWMKSCRGFRSRRGWPASP